MSVSPSSPLLQVDGLHIRYETGRSMWGTPRFRDVVHGVSFDVQPGQTFGLVGESGSGKSTIGKALLRQIPILSGTISFEGQRISDLPLGATPLSYRRAVQVVFQNPLQSLNPRMRAHETVAEAVRFHIGLTGASLKARTRELFDDVGLSARVDDRYPGELSGGQQQRVAIARALASNPKLVICDEAVSALDVSTQAQVITLLRKLQERHGVSYVFISHDLGIVRSICHSVGVLRQGDFVDIGDVASVYHRPTSDYTKNLLDAVPRPSLARASLATGS